MFQVDYISVYEIFPGCFGPAHHVAIKCRRTDVEYDVGVLYAQMNTEIYHWLKIDTGDWVAIETGNKRLLPLPLCC